MEVLVLILNETLCVLLFNQNPSSGEMLFFSIWVFCHKHSWFKGQQGKGEGIYLTPLYHFSSLPLFLKRGIAREHEVLLKVGGFFLKLFNCCPMANPRPALGHCWGNSLTNAFLITVFWGFWPKDHWEPPNEVESLSLAECLVGFNLLILIITL